MPKLFISVVKFSGEIPYVTLSTKPLTDDVDAWGNIAVKVELIGFFRQPDAPITAGVVRNVFTAAGFDVVMEAE
jgi:hypothetical protein